MPPQDISPSLCHLFLHTLTQHWLLQGSWTSYICSDSEIQETYRQKKLQGLLRPSLKSHHCSFFFIQQATQGQSQVSMGRAEQACECGEVCSIGAPLWRLDTTAENMGLTLRAERRLHLHMVLMTRYSLIQNPKDVVVPLLICLLGHLSTSRNALLTVRISWL